MAAGMPLSMQELEIPDLVPVVTQIIDHPHIDHLDWDVHPISGVGGSQMSGGLGIFRLIGSAHAAGQIYPWSVIVKVVTGSNSTNSKNLSCNRMRSTMTSRWRRHASEAYHCRVGR